MSSEEIVGEWPTAEEVATVPSPDAMTVSRPTVVEVVQAVEEELRNDSVAFVRASDLETHLRSDTVGKVLSLLADNSAAVASNYRTPEAATLDVSRWGRSSSAIRWEVRWADA